MSEHDDPRRDAVDDPDEPPALPAWVTRALAAPAVWADVPAGSEESIVAAIDTERAQSDPGGAPATRSAPVRRPSRRHTMARLAAVAAAVIVIAVGVVLVTGDDAGEGVARTIVGTELAPEASATAVVDELTAGVAIRLDIIGLEPAPPGTYYQGWVRSDDGDLVSVGSFHVRGGDSLVTLWAGVDLDDYPTLTVTLQREGEGTDSSGEVVLRGPLRP